jgi:hypothetical protein
VDWHGCGCGVVIGVVQQHGMVILVVEAVGTTSLAAGGNVILLMILTG